MFFHTIVIMLAPQQKQNLIIAVLSLHFLLYFPLHFQHPVWLGFARAPPTPVRSDLALNILQALNNQANKLQDYTRLKFDPS